MNYHLHHLMRIPWWWMDIYNSCPELIHYSQLQGCAERTVGRSFYCPAVRNRRGFVLGGNSGSLIGVAISASLLPPAVNAVSIITGIWYLEKIDTKLNLFFSRDNELLLVIAELQMQDFKVIAIYFFNNLTLIVMYFLIGLKKVFHIV